MEKRSWQKTVLRRLIGSFILILVPIYLLCVIMYQTGLNSLRKEISIAMEAQVSYYMNSLESEIARIRSLQADLINDRDLNQLAAIPQSLGMIDKVFGMLRVQNRLIAIKESSEYIQGVTSYIPALDRQISNSSVSEFDGPGFDRLKAAASDFERRIACISGNLYLLMQYPLPFSSAARKVQFLIAVELSQAQLGRALESMRGFEGSGVALADGSGRYLLSAGSAAELEPGLLGTIMEGADRNDSSAKVMPMGKRRYLRVLASSESLDVTLCKFVPEDLVFKSVRGFRLWFYIFIAAALLIIVIYSVSIYRFIHKPLSSLAESFKLVERGDFGIRIDHKRDDEFRYIYRHFNSMVENLKELIDKVYNQQILVQQARMKQLQSQINPHFLYNSFFMLNTMVRNGDTENLERITGYLGRYFQFVTRNASDSVALAEEVGHARVYADIQAMRFSNRVKVSFPELPGAFASIEVPRLILQPIIENAFEHSIGPDPDDAELSVGFEAAGGALFISIGNSGKELDRESFGRILRTVGEPRADEEIGALRNIHQRLRLKFGPESGLEFKKAEGGGLLVSMRIPTGEGQ